MQQRVVRLIGGMFCLLAIAGCEQQASAPTQPPVLTSQQAQEKIKLIQADPRMTAQQKNAAIESIRRYGQGSR